MSPCCGSRWDCHSTLKAAGGGDPRPATILSSQPTDTRCASPPPPASPIARPCGSDTRTTAVSSTVSLTPLVTLPPCSPPSGLRPSPPTLPPAPSAGGGPLNGGDLPSGKILSDQPTPPEPMTVYTVTRLPRRNPRADELWQRSGQRGRGAAIGNLRPGDGDESVTQRGRGQGAGDRCVGRGVTLNPVGGMGRVMVADLEAVMIRARDQYRSDRRAAALERRGI